MGFPGAASGKEPTCQFKRHKRHRFDPWVRKIPGGGHGNPLQYSCLENLMDRGAWCATVQRVKYDWSNWACSHSEVEDAYTLSFSNSSSRKHIYRVMKGYDKSIHCSILCNSNKKRSNSKMSTRMACLRKLFIKGHIIYQLKWMCICYRWTRTNLKIIMLGEKIKFWTITQCDITYCNTKIMRKFILKMSFCVQI